MTSAPGRGKKVREVEGRRRKAENLDEGSPPAVKDGAEGKKDGWIAPEMRRVGPLGNILAAGGGKISIAADGDGRKPSPQT